MGKLILKITNYPIAIILIIIGVDLINLFAILLAKYKANGTDNIYFILWYIGIISILAILCGIGLSIYFKSKK